MQFKREYIKLDPEKVRNEILEDFNNNDIDLKTKLHICNLCRKNCFNCFKQKNKCFQPMRELYDEKYAIEG